MAADAESSESDGSALRCVAAPTVTAAATAPSLQLINNWDHKERGGGGGGGGGRRGQTDCQRTDDATDAYRNATVLISAMTSVTTLLVETISRVSRRACVHLLYSAVHISL